MRQKDLFTSCNVGTDKNDILPSDMNVCKCRQNGNYTSKSYRMKIVLYIIKINDKR